MNSLERVLTALQRQEPDRVPTFEWDTAQNVIEALVPGASYFDFVEAMDLDAVVVAPDYATEKMADNLYRDEWGVVRRKGWESYSIPIEEQAPIGSRTELERYQPPRAVAPGRFDTLRRAIRRFKGQRAMVIKVRDAFSTPRDLRGYSKFLMDTELQPDLVKDLVELSISHNIEVAREAIRLGADIVATGDDYADNSGPLISPARFRQLFLPTVGRLVRAVKDCGALFIKHTDGNVWSLIEMLVGCGIDCLDPIDPLAGMDIVKVKKEYGSRIALKGNIDCAGTLSFKTAKEVEREVKQCITRISPGGGHIISSSNSIHSGVRPESYKVMLKTIREFGVYPIAVGTR